MDLARRKAKAGQLVMGAAPALCIDHKGRIIGMVNIGDEEALDLLDNLHADLVASAVKAFLEDRRAGVSAVASLERKFEDLEDKVHTLRSNWADLQEENEYLRRVISRWFKAYGVRLTTTSQERAGAPPASYAAQVVL